MLLHTTPSPHTLHLRNKLTPQQAHPPYRPGPGCLAGLMLPDGCGALALDSSIDDDMMDDDAIDTEICNLLALKQARRTARTQSRRQLLLQQLAAGMSPAGGFAEGAAPPLQTFNGTGQAAAAPLDTTGATLQQLRVSPGGGGGGWAAPNCNNTSRSSIDIGHLQHHLCAALQPSEASSALSLLSSSLGADSGLLPAVPVLLGSELVTPAQSGEPLPSPFSPAGAPSDADLAATLEQLSISAWRQQQQQAQPCSASLVMTSSGGIAPLQLQASSTASSALLPAGCMLSPLDHQHCFSGVGLPLAAFASLPPSMPGSPAAAYVVGSSQPPLEHGEREGHGHLPRRAATFTVLPSSMPFTHMTGTLPARPATGGQSGGMAHMVLHAAPSSPNLSAASACIMSSPGAAGCTALPQLARASGSGSFGAHMVHVAPAAQPPPPPPAARRASSTSGGCWPPPGVQAGAGGPPPALKGTGVFLPGISVARSPDAGPGAAAPDRRTCQF